MNVRLPRIIPADRDGPQGRCFSLKISLDLAGGRGVLLASPDGGLSWRRVAILTSVDLLGMHFLSTGTGWTEGEMGAILTVPMFPP